MRLGTRSQTLSHATTETVALALALGLVALLLAFGLTAPDPTAPPKGPVERFTLHPGQAAAVLRSQLQGPQCDALLLASAIMADHQYVTFDIPSLGRFEVQLRRPGEYTVQPRSGALATTGCVWQDTPIPTGPLAR